MTQLKQLGFLIEIGKIKSFLKCSFKEKFHYKHKREKFLNEPVWHELQKTYTHFADSWSGSLKTSDVVFALNDFLCPFVSGFILIDTTNFSGWLKKPR